MIKRTNFILALTSAFLIGYVGHVWAASTVISDGTAAITSTAGDKIYRKRAIENALQNIALSRGQALTSFTIIENGQMLIDQIQTISKMGILSFKVIKEHKKNKQYHVKVEAIVEDQYSEGKKSNHSEICRMTNYPAVDWSFRLRIDPQQFPAWMEINSDWILGKVNGLNFKPKLVLKSSASTKKSSMELYTLFKDSNVSKNTENIYHLFLDLNFTKTQKETFFVKNNIIRLVANSEIRRNGIVIENKSQNYDFILNKKFGLGTPVQSNRKIWEDEKEKIVKSIFEILKNKLDHINCAFIKAELKRKKNKYYINFGALDGITEEDIFVTDTARAEKFYFRVQDLKDRSTQLKLISETNEIELKDKQTVRIVEEL